MLGTPLLLGLVAYEHRGPLNYRTLINNLNAYICGLMAFYSVSGFNVLTLRAVAGPLPGPLCAMEILQVTSPAAL